MNRLNIFAQETKTLPPPPPPSQPAVMFLKFSQIPFIAADEVVEKAKKLDLLINNTQDWKKIHQGIDVLRSFNKTFPEQVQQILDSFGGHILKFLSCQRKEIVKNDLALIQEVFMNGKLVNLDPQCIHILVTSVIQIIDNTNKLSVRDCLVSLSSNVITNETLLESCMIADTLPFVGLRMIARFLETLGTSFTNLSNECLITLMRTLRLNQCQQDMETVIQVNQIAIFLYNLLGEQYFQLLIQNTLSPEDGQYFIQSIQMSYQHIQSQPVRQPLSNQTNILNNLQNNNKTDYCKENLPR